MSGHVKKTAILSLGQLVGLAFSFLIPVFLSRYLTIENYGTYKQLILMQGIFLLTVQMGLDGGLFYFIRRRPQHGRVFSSNAVAAEFAICLFLSLILIAAGRHLGIWLHNETLPRYLPAFGLLLLFSVPAQHFEHYLTVVDRIAFSVWVAILQEAGKAIAVIGGFYFFHSLRVVLLGMAAVSGLKLAALLRFNAYGVAVGWRQRWIYFHEQVRFALPLGFAGLMNGLFKLDKFVVSAMFSLRDFTLYSVGCFDVPWLPGLGNTMADLMSFDMVSAHREGDAGRIQSLWRGTKFKTALIQIPAACFLVAFAGTVIPFLFSDQYAASARYFRWFGLTLLFAPFDCDILFRTFARNRLHLKLTLA